MGSGGTDLGRETEIQVAKLFAMGLEGIKPPVLLVNTGDTGAFTDGMTHALQHFIEASEKGFPMPVIFLQFANNSAISSRIDYGKKWGDGGDFGVNRIQERFRQFGPLFNEGFVTHASDPGAGAQSVRDSGGDK